MLGVAFFANVDVLPEASVGVNASAVRSQVYSVRFWGTPGRSMWTLIQVWSMDELAAIMRPLIFGCTDESHAHACGEYGEALAPTAAKRVFAGFYFISFLVLQNGFLFNLLTSIFVEQMTSDQIERQEAVVEQRALQLEEMQMGGSIYYQPEPAAGTDEAGDAAGSAAAARRTSTSTTATARHRGNSIPTTPTGLRSVRRGAAGGFAAVRLAAATERRLQSLEEKLEVALQLLQADRRAGARAQPLGDAVEDAQGRDEGGATSSPEGQRASRPDPQRV